MQGTALIAYGSKNDWRMDNGKISVGAKLVKTKANTAKNTMYLFLGEVKTQRAIPVNAIINVGDSAL